MSRPEIRDPVEADEPDGEPEIPPRPAADLERRPGQHRLPVFFLDDVARHREAEVHPHEDGAEQRAVEEVDGEGVPAEPEQGPVGEEGLGAGREVDPHRDADEADPGVEPGCLVVLGEDVHRGLAHHLGPAHPLRFVFRVRGEQQAEQYQGRREDSPGPLAGCAPGEMRRVLREIGKESTEEELHPKGRCSMLARRSWL